MATLKLTTAEFRKLGKRDTAHTERNTRNQATASALKIG